MEENDIIKNELQQKFLTRVKLTIRSENGGFFGPGVAELMECIEETGSIKDACIQMGLSYTKGRRILKRAEQEIGYALVEIRYGGAGGGASCITEAGRACLASYRELEADVAAYAERRFSETLGKQLTLPDETPLMPDAADGGRH